MTLERIICSFHFVIAISEFSLYCELSDKLRG